MFSRVASRVTRTAGRRHMGGGGHHAKVEYTGIDKIVRKFFPEDHHVAIAVITAYTTIGIIIAKWPSNKKPIAVAVAASAGGIPDADSPEFDAWINTDGNLEKLLNSLA